MRVLLADKLPDHARIRLAANGMEVVLEPTLKGSELAQRLEEFDPDVLVVRSTKVQAEHLQAARSLSLIVRAGAGVNTIDVPDAAARGSTSQTAPGRTPPPLPSWHSASSSLSTATSRIMCAISGPVSGIKRPTAMRSVSADKR